MNLDSNYQMMQSQLTTELLYSILVSITKYGVGTVIEGKSHKEFRDLDFNNTNKFKIDSMVVKNPDKLRVQDADLNLEEDEEEAELDKLGLI